MGSPLPCSLSGSSPASKCCAYGGGSEGCLREAIPDDAAEKIVTVKDAVDFIQQNA